MTDSRNHLMVAALDFGTTYSGYAFSMISEFKNDPLNIHANPMWESATRAVSSLKTPTCLLLKKDDRDFVAFGYDAENQYADIVMDAKLEDYYYFHRFKMNLHNNKVRNMFYFEGNVHFTKLKTKFEFIFIKNNYCQREYPLSLKRIQLTYVMKI